MLLYQQLAKNELLTYVEVVRAFPGHFGGVLMLSMPHIQVVVREDPKSGKEHSDERATHEQEAVLPVDFTLDDVLRIGLLEVRTQLLQIVRAHERRATKINELSRRLASVRKP